MRFPSVITRSGSVAVIQIKPAAVSPAERASAAPATPTKARAFMLSSLTGGYGKACGPSRPIRRTADGTR